MTRRICLPGPPTGLNRDIQHPDDLSFSVPPSLITHHRWCRNINLLSITYAFRPRLRDRLTLGRLPLPRKPKTYGEWVSHPFYRYSCLHSRFRYLQEPSRVSLHRLTERSATTHTARRRCASEASVHGFSPDTFSAQKPLIRPVSCYAFFKGWLLLSQPPGCYGISTSFHT